MYLTISTRMLGVPRVELPISHPDQPLLLQIAAIAFDGTGNEVKRICEPLRPVSDGTAHLNDTSSTDPKVAFNWLVEMAAKSDFLIGHNIHIDLYALRVFGARLTGRDWTPLSPTYCTMINSASRMTCPPKSGLELKSQAPTLSEALRHFCNEGFDETPDRLNSVRACHRLFQALTA